MNKILLLLLFITQNFLFSQEKWKMQFYNEVIDREVFIFADNEEDMPMSAKFNFNLKNLVSPYINNQIIVIPARTKKFHITTLKPVKVDAGNSFSYTSTLNFGNALQEKFDEDYAYSLPFEKGRTHLIFQGYNGKLSHQNDLALDFNLKTGDEIRSARAGLVVEMVDKNTQSCPNISCAKFNNKIIIMHSDGTFADYAHLKYKGTVVKKGDVVKKDQLIGYSGNTGYSTGPHLHFSVFINRIDGKRTYIKTIFKTSESDGTLLEEGKSYTKNY